MSFCPICNADHDPRFSCVDRTSSIMAEAGMMISKKELKVMAKTKKAKKAKE